MAQETTLDFRLVQRICYLQKALDQALSALDDLRVRVQHQKFLELQLEKTEQFSNVQQQLIAHFQQEIAQKSQWHGRLLHQLVFGVDTLFDQQQVELNQLRFRIQQSQTEVQDYLLQLTYRCQQQASSPDPSACDAGCVEADVMVMRSLIVSVGKQLELAYGHIHTLTDILHQYQSRLVQVEANLDQVQYLPEVVLLSPAEADLTGAGLLEKLDEELQTNSSLFAIVHELKAQQLRVKELERELTDQYQVQTQLKRRFQQLAAERDYYKQELEKLSQTQQALAAAPDGEVIDSSDWIPVPQPEEEPA